MAFWTYVVLTSVVCFVIATLLWVVTTPFDRDRRVSHIFSCVWASLYAFVNPLWRVRVRGREHIAPGVPYVIVANHTSLADIVLAFLLFRQFKWVSKASMFSVPVIGWNMRYCRYVPLVRGDKTSGVVMMQKCREWLRRGMSVFMFPEGTRSRDGALGPFKHGAFTLARQAEVAVVPVVIHGGHALIPKSGKSFANKARLLMEVLEPVAPAGFADAESYAEAVRTRISQALADAPSTERHAPTAKDPAGARRAHTSTPTPH